MADPVPCHRCGTPVVPNEFLEDFGMCIAAEIGDRPDPFLLCKPCLLACMLWLAEASRTPVPKPPVGLDPA